MGDGRSYPVDDLRESRETMMEREGDTVGGGFSWGRGQRLETKEVAREISGLHHRRPGSVNVSGRGRS